MYKLHIHCILKSGSFFFLKKASLLDRMLVVPGHLFGGVLISSPELDLRRYLWTPAIKWPACALVKLWLQPKQKKKAIYYQHELHKWFHSQNYTTLSNILFKNGTQIFLWFTVWRT